MEKETMLCADHVTFRYREAGKNAVDDLSLCVRRGEFVAVLGANGCGKSTLAKHFNAILLPASGQVLIEGISTEQEENLMQLRQKVGMVFQNPDNQIVATVVEEDVAFALENLGVEPSVMRERVDEAMKLAGIYQYRDKAPHHLSGGQKQRVAIARTLMQDAPVLIFDDSLSAVDAETDAEIRASLHKAKGSATVILISHRVTTLMQADCILVLDGGRVAEMGTHSELLAKNGIYRRIYDIQMSSADRDLLAEGGEDPGGAQTEERGRV